MTSFGILQFIFPMIIFAVYIIYIISLVVFLKKRNKQNEKYVVDLEAKLKQINDVKKDQED